jgi:hypothetical protein
MNECIHDDDDALAWEFSPKCTEADCPVLKKLEEVK